MVLKAIAPNPDSRFQSAAVFASELRALAAKVDARDQVDDTEAGPPPPPKRGAGVFVAIGLLIVALAGAAVSLSGPALRARLRFDGLRADGPCAKNRIGPTDVARGTARRVGNPQLRCKGRPPYVRADEAAG